MGWRFSLDPHHDAPPATGSSPASVVGAASVWSLLQRWYPEIQPLWFGSFGRRHVGGPVRSCTVVVAAARRGDESETEHRRRDDSLARSLPVSHHFPLCFGDFRVVDVTVPL